LRKIVDKILVSLVFVGLVLALLVEIVNLNGLGSQEYFLHHPDFPDGPQFRRDVNAGFGRLVFFTLVTAALLIAAIYARRKGNKLLFYQSTLLTFLFAFYLPIITFLNGLVIRGIVMALIILGLASFSLLELLREKNGK
jgi:hypothetical protein